MNWDLFILLSNTLTFYYWMPLVLCDLIVGFLRYFTKLQNVRWSLIRLFRFLFPARKLMFFIFVIVHPLQHGFDWVYYTNAIVFFIIAFLSKDNHGDDPRDKKPSKVAAFIKAVGHRLVIVPAKG